MPYVFQGARPVSAQARFTASLEEEFRAAVATQWRK